MWRRAGAQPSVTLSLPHLRGTDVELEPLYPLDLPAWTADWNRDAGELTLTAQRVPASARLFRIVHRTSPIPSPTEGFAR